MNDYEKLIEQVDYIARGQGLGSLSESIVNVMAGFNHRGVGNPVPYNQDNQGMTFFTRPRLNLSYDNLGVDRRLSVLAGKRGQVAKSFPPAIRQWLDPEVARTLFNAGERSHLIDPFQAFIPLLSNNLISLSGWPDPIAEEYVSEEGLAKEAWAMVDGVDTIYSSFVLQGTFRNMVGDPISMMIYVWIIYMSLVYQGEMYPYPDSEMLREIDYQTRIYRLILDPTRTYVQKIAACGAAFPTSPALGQAFDFSADTPFEQSRASQISVPFRAIGAIYQDPILVHTFNETVCMFNAAMVPGQREKYMRRIPRSEQTLFNYTGYPWIDLDTYELQWWTFQDEYDLHLRGNAAAEATLNATSQFAGPTQSTGVHPSSGHTGTNSTTTGGGFHGELDKHSNRSPNP